MKLKHGPNLNTPDSLDEYWQREWDNYMSKPFRDDLYREFLETLPRNSRVLDVASGPSRLRMVAAELGHRTFALDLSPYVIGRLSWEGVDGRVCDILQWDGERLGRFDAAVCSECLEHLIRPPKACDLIAAHVDRALFTVPNLNGEPDGCDMHVMEFTAESLRELLERYWGDVDMQATEKYHVAWVSERREP